MQRKLVWLVCVLGALVLAWLGASWLENKVSPPGSELTSGFSFTLCLVDGGCGVLAFAIILWETWVFKKIPEGETLGMCLGAVFIIFTLERLITFWVCFSESQSWQRVRAASLVPGAEVTLRTAPDDGTVTDKSRVVIHCVASEKLSVQGMPAVTIIHDCSAFTTLGQLKQHGPKFFAGSPLVLGKISGPGGEMANVFPSPK